MAAWLHPGQPKAAGVPLATTSKAPASNENTTNNAIISKAVLIIINFFSLSIGIIGTIDTRIWDRHKFNSIF